MADNNDKQASNKQAANSQFRKLRQAEDGKRAMLDYRERGRRHAHQDRALTRAATGARSGRRCDRRGDASAGEEKSREKILTGVA